MSETATYVGIADAHGIESFRPSDSAGLPLAALNLRAMSNRHRHAVVYEVKLGAEGVKEVSQLLADDECVDALKTLKKRASMVGLSVECGSSLESMARSWELIPNPDLDPYH